MTEYPVPSWGLALAVLAGVTLLISGVTLLVGRALRHRSAPTREAALRVGLCLMLVWPLLVVGGAVIGVRSDGPAAPPKVESVSAIVESPEVAPEPSIAAAVTVPTVIASQADPQPVFQSTSIPELHRNEPAPVMASEASPPAPVEATSPPTSLLAPEPKSLSALSPTPDTNSREVPRTTTPVPVATSPPSPALVISPPSTIPVSIQATWRWLCFLWAVGTLVAWLALLRDLVRLRRIRRQFIPCHHEAIHAILTQAMQATGLRRRPEMFLFQEVGSPCTSGVRRPILILPPSMLTEPLDDPATLRGVLTHECAHIVRRDVAWSLLARVAQSIYWWEPGLRRIVRQLSHLREEICDNHVLSSSIDARLYAKALVDFAAGPLFRPLIGVIGMVGNNNPLSDRVERLLQVSPDQTTRLGRRSKWGVALIVALVSALLGVIGARAEISGALSRVLYPEVEERAHYPTQTTAMLIDGPARFRMRNESKEMSAAMGNVDSPPPPANGSAGAAMGPVTSKAAAAVEAAADQAAAQAWDQEVATVVPRAKESSQPSFPRSSIPAPAGNDFIPEPFPDDLKPQGILKTADPLPEYITMGIGVPNPSDFPPGTPVVLTLVQLEEENLFPKRVRIEGLTVIAPKVEAVSEPAFVEPSPPDPATTAPATEPSDPAITPPSEAEKTEPSETSPSAKNTPTETAHAITLSIPRSLSATLLTYLARGGSIGVTKAITPTADTEKMPLLNACHLGGKSTFQIQIEALADEKSQFRGLSCWGRELPSTTPDKGIGELTQLLTRWKLECLKVASVGKAVPPVLVGEGMRIAVSPQNGEFRVFEPDALPSKQPRAEVLQLVVGIQVFDDMRYGDVQSIVKACVDLKLMPYFMNSITCCPGCKVPSRVFTPVQLTMIYDSSGQLVGDQPILLAEKAGATGVQVVTENQIDTLLATFTARHWPKTPTIILTGEHEVSLDLLQTFNVRANRAGISVVRRSSFGEELSLSATDQLVPLMDEAPLPERGEIVDPSQNDAPRYDPSTDAPKESNGPFRGRSPTTEPDLTAPPSDDLTPPAGTFRGTQDLSPSGDSMPDADQIPINREGRVRVNPRPIPEESLVQEH